MPEVIRKKVLALIMAGGRGTRLGPLTADRTKAAVPFGGKYRLIDIALSNFVNSHVYSIYVLTQFKSQSLIEHLRLAWDIGGALRDQFVIPVPAQMRVGQDWYRGTADSIYQALYIVRAANPEIVAIFGSDHIYRMDIRQMVRFHCERNASATVAAFPVPLEEAKRCGVISVDDDGRVAAFEEKPTDPQPAPGRPTEAFVSMGNYLFTKDALIEHLEQDARMDTEHDFGRNILPAMVRTGELYAYDFRKNVVPGTLPGEENTYWRDVGTVEAYYDANMDLRSVSPLFNLYSGEWPIRSAHTASPPVKFVHESEERVGQAVSSVVCEGTVISGSTVRNSVIGRGVFIHSYALVEDSIIMDNVVIGRRARIKRAIIDKHVRVPEDAEIGYDLEEDEKHYYVTDGGIVVIPKGKFLVRPPSLVEI